MNHSSRTYIKTTKGTYIHREDKEFWLIIHNRYINNNESTKELSEEIGVTNQVLRRYFKKFNLNLLSTEERHKRRVASAKKNYLEKYGVESPFQLESVKEKIKISNKEKYGVEYAMQSNIIREKSKKTCLEKYGVDHINKSPTIREKTKNTCLEKYGVEYSLQSEEVKAKGVDTSLRKYGTYHPSQSKEIKDKMVKTNIEKYGVGYPIQSEEVREKIKKTCLEKYGVDSASKSEIVKNSIKNNNLRKYGVTSTAVIQSVIDKKNKTLMERYGTLNVAGLEETREKIRLTYSINKSSEIISILKELNYTLEEPFKGVFNYVDKKYLSWKKYKFKHNTCGTFFSRSLCNIKIIKCPHCYPHQSAPELKLRNFIKSHTNANLEYSIRYLISPLEIDIFIPDTNTAFEYNGSYWHSTFHGTKDRFYHRVKTEKCLEKGVKLYHIWKHYKESIVESKIKILLGKVKNKCFARKLDIKKVNIKDRRDFFNANHLHGDANSSFALGLYSNDELLQCISFRKHKEGIEIARFATKLDYSIVGGFSRLLKYSIINCKKLGYNKIITYCDRDWTPDYKDSVYYKKNFTFVHDSGPMLSYISVGKDVLFSREKFQKHKIEKMFPDIYDKELTADEMLSKKGIYPVYNSGNWKFYLDI